MLDTTLGLGSVAVSRPAHPRLIARWAGLAVLLAAEVAALTLAFDMLAPFEHDPRWWAGPLRQSRLVAQVVAAVAMATLALGGRRLGSELGRLAASPGRRDRSGWFLAGHLAAFAGFAGLTSWVSAGAARPTPVGGGMVLAWALAGLATGSLWAASALPAALWGALARTAAGVLAAGAVVGGSAWLLGQWTQTLWAPLGRSTLWSVEQLLRLAFRDVVCDPSRMAVGTSSFAVTVAPQCSGYEGIGLVWALLAGSLWLFRDRFRFPRALLLIPIGTALIWVANAVRIAGLVAVGTLISPRIAVGGFHSQTGWIAFNLVGLGLIAGAHRCRWFLARDPEPRDPTRSSPTASHLMPLLTLVGSAMVTGAFTEGFDRAYPLRMAGVLAVLCWYRRDYAAWRPSWSLSWSWGAVGIGAAVFGLWMALEPAPVGSPAGFDPRRELTPAWAVAWLVARVVGSVLIVPLAEELAFRGYLIRRLISADFREVLPGRLTWVSLAASSVAFGALHGRWLAGTLAGLAYALALHRRGSLGDAVLAHATTNALIAAYVLATATWSLWS